MQSETRDCDKTEEELSTQEMKKKSNERLNSIGASKNMIVV